MSADPDESDQLDESIERGRPTVGYGDLAPALGLGRALAIALALTGRIYLVTVVAVIVSNLGGSARRD